MGQGGDETKTAQGMERRPASLIVRVGWVMTLAALPGRSGVGWRHPLLLFLPPPFDLDCL